MRRRDTIYPGAPIVLIGAPASIRKQFAGLTRIPARDRTSSLLVRECDALLRATSVAATRRGSSPREFAACPQGSQGCAWTVSAREHRRPKATHQLVKDTLVQRPLGLPARLELLHGVSATAHAHAPGCSSRGTSSARPTLCCTSHSSLRSCRVSQPRRMPRRTAPACSASLFALLSDSARDRGPRSCTA